MLDNTTTLAEYEKSILFFFNIKIWQRMVRVCNMMETTAKELQTRHKKQEARTEWGKMLFKSQCKVEQ